MARRGASAGKKKNLQVSDLEIKMAGETGLEPAALGFGDRCSTN
jgi:hypothetical protein